MASLYHFRLDHFPYDICRDIADTIKKFYPLDINPLDESYNQHAGVIQRKEIIANNIVDNKVFRKRWVSFLNRISKDLGLNREKLVNTTFGVGPSFSGDLILEHYQDEAMSRQKRLTFAVSLIGPFYSVCGVDETTIFDHYEYITSYRAINMITASPFKEYADNFNYLQRCIESSFKEYKFVPISMAFKQVQNVFRNTGENMTVYEALFNHLFNYYYAPYQKYRGDKYYGYGEPLSKIKITLAPPSPLI